jgi:hypothetical protein
MSAQSTETLGAYVFRKMALVYGSKFTALWADVDPEEAKAEWSKALHGVSREDLRRGIAALYHTRYCPTLPEFLALCEPPNTMPLAHQFRIEETIDRTDSPTARLRLAEIAGKITRREPSPGKGIEWAHRLVERSQWDEHVTTQQLTFACEAIALWETTHGTAHAQGEGEPLREPGCDDEVAA